MWVFVAVIPVSATQTRVSVRQKLYNPLAKPGSEFGGPQAERGARTYNRGLWAEPPAGSRARAPGKKVKGPSPLKPKAIFAFAQPEQLANMS